MAMGLAHGPHDLKEAYKELLLKRFLDINKLLKKTQHVDELSLNKWETEASDLLSNTGFSTNGENIQLSK